MTYAYMLQVLKGGDVVGRLYQEKTKIESLVWDLTRKPVKENDTFVQNTLRNHVVVSVTK